MYIQKAILLIIVLERAMKWISIYMTELKYI
ncbi:hypothetical protein SAMN04490355_105232 [Pelosinus propionicus DSM 13327]|uniref:Uncharacterized protein n=1 Tax=Pelosinus propionicus DSM 13327 TaxID=1123291 RepID=A0A1I4NV02_9FIRM|nr:hypothetical protein SAMN04490355_105232 [Pelosinus propionicus DSM 13327]